MAEPIHIGQAKISSGRLAKATDIELPLLRCVALKGFPDLANTTLLQLARYLSVDLGLAPTTFELLKGLIEHFLPNIEQGDILTILQSRGTKPDNDTANASLTRPDIMQVFEGNEHELKTWQADHEKEAVHDLNFMAEVHEWTIKLEA